MTTNTTCPPNAHATSADDSSNTSAQPSPSATEPTTLSGASTNLSAHPTEVMHLVNDSNQTTQQPDPSNYTFDKLAPKTMPTISASAIFFDTDINDNGAMQTSSTQQLAVTDAEDEERPGSPSASATPAATTSDFTININAWNDFYNEFVQSITYRLAKATATPLTSDIIDNAAANPQCTQKPLTMAMITPTSTQSSTPTSRKDLKGEPDTDSSTSDLPSNNMTINATEPNQQPATPNDYDNLVRQSTGSAVKQCRTSLFTSDSIKCTSLCIQSTFASKISLYYLWQSWLHSKKCLFLNFYKS